MHPVGQPWGIGAFAQIDLANLTIPADNAPQNTPQTAAGHRLPAAGAPRLRYSAITQSPLLASLNASSAHPPQVRMQRSASNAAEPAVDSAELKRLLGLRPGAQFDADQKAFNTLLDYANICQANNMTERYEMLNTGWAHLKHYETEHADSDLARMRVNIRSLFFDTAPAARSAHWQHLSPAARQDLNLLFDIGDTLRTSRLPIGENAYKNAYANAYESAWPRLALVLQANSRPDSALRASDTPYLMALTQALREHDAANHPFFHNRLETLPSDIRAFIADSMPPPAEKAGPTHAAYVEQRQEDLAALLYRWQSGDCSAAGDSRLTLASLRATLAAASQSEEKDNLFLQDMFAFNGTATDIYHDGMTLRNAVGKSVSDLAAYLDTHIRPHPGIGPDFALMHHAYKKTLIRRKLYQLEESPDYPIGSPLQSMATILMRLSDQPPGNRYRTYRNKLDLLESWERRNQQWIDKRDFALSPELYNAIHMESTNGLMASGLYWYRDVWDTRIVQAIKASELGRAGSAEMLRPLWQWLERHAPGWQAPTQCWSAISPERYANSVMHAVDALYQIRQATTLPEFELIDAYTGAGYWRYHASLHGLPEQVQQTLTTLARQFDLQAFHTERILSDNWLSTSYRLLDSSYYRTVLELQPAPSYAVEIEAYLTLLRHGMTHEQITTSMGQVLCDVDANDYHRRPRPLYEAFIAVIRNPHRDARLRLPNGRLIYPHHIIDKSFDDYRDNLDKHPWIIGRAKQNLRDRGLPFLASILKEEIESIAAPLRKKASKATESGTQLADHFFGAMPITAPLLRMSRAVRDGNYEHVPYYVLVLTRDVLAAVALSHALSAAYISPIISAARYSASFMLASTTFPHRSFRTYRIRSAGYLDLKPRPLTRKSKPHDITLTGDQTHGLQTKIARARTQGKAAREYSASAAPDNSTQLIGSGQLFDPDYRHKMLKMLLPANEKEEMLQQQNIWKIGTQIAYSLLNITISDNMEDAGVQAGLQGVSQIDAFTLCDGEAVGRRQTVQDVYDWLIKASNHRMRNVHQVLGDNLQVAYGEGVEAAWAAHPAWRYDPAHIVNQTYTASPRLRALLNWHDDHAIEKCSLSIVIDLQCSRATVTRSASSTIIRIALPANPDNLPFIMNEMHSARQPLRLALIESLVAAITGLPAPASPLRQRGANIWLANAILLQSGRRFEPRINAAFFHDHQQARQAGHQDHNHQSIHRAAEIEDQYLERIGMENLLAIRHGKYQGEIVAQRPTVAAVTALLRQLDYPVYLRKQSAPARSDALARADFHQRFRRGFSVDYGSGNGSGSENSNDNHNAIATELIDVFFFDCYVNSSLFRKLFDSGITQLRQRWTIFPNGFDGDGAAAEYIPIPSEGIINAGTRNAVYLGLLEIEAIAGNVSISSPSTRLPSQLPLLPMEPFRAILDGVIAALSDDIAIPPPPTALHHRGARTWFCDTVLLQAGWPANKRLAELVIRSSNHDDIKRLSRLAGANRRAARVEDAEIARWIDQQEQQKTA
ncbi:MAG: hypothetical protein JWQ10_2499 [Herbaspirillum sp.]|nr:hypothetical protein [Herbaspirillum sp.]